MGDLTDVRLSDTIGVGVVTRLIHRDLVEDVLAATGRRERRVRLLPARVVVYLVLALSLFMTDGYEEVVRKLTNGLRGLRIWRDEWEVPVPSAISQARARLGSEPLAELFRRVCVPVAKPSTPGGFFAGLRLMAVDGTALDVPDTPGNAAEFGFYAGATPQKSAFPQVRLVSLVELGTHATVAAKIDAIGVGERRLFDRVINDFSAGMLVLADRGFYSYHAWVAARKTGAELLWRIPDNIVLPALEYLPDGSFRSELLPAHLKASIKTGRPTTEAEAFREPIRVVEYMVTGRGETTTIRIITSLQDHTEAKADDLAALYAQRWEHELAFDEIKEHQIHPDRVLRSRTPDLIRQEIWALLITHYAVRHLIAEAADDLSADPDSFSFTRTINVVRRQVINQAAFSPLKAQPGDH